MTALDSAEQAAIDAWLAENEVTRIPTGKSSFVYPVWDPKSGQIRNVVKDSWRNTMGFGDSRNAANNARRQARIKRMQHIRDTFDPNETAQEIADRVGIPRGRVLDYLKELGLKSRVPMPKLPTYVGTPPEDITRAWMSPMRRKEAAASIGLKCINGFAKRARALGLPNRPSELLTDWQERWDAIRQEWQG